jgi:hypothetical protein
MRGRPQLLTVIDSIVGRVEYRDLPDLGSPLSKVTIVF